MRVDCRRPGYYLQSPGSPWHRLSRAGFSGSRGGGGGQPLEDRSRRSPPIVYAEDLELSPRWGWNLRPSPYWKYDEVIQTAKPLALWPRSTPRPHRPLQSGRRDELCRTRSPRKSRQNLAPVAEFESSDVVSGLDRPFSDVQANISNHHLRMKVTKTHQ